MIFGTYFILRGHDMHIDSLRLLYLVIVICPLMQEHSLQLKKRISQVPEDGMLKIRRSVTSNYLNQIACYVRPKKRCKSNTSTVSVLANRSLHQDLMHSRCRGTMVPNVWLQALTLSLPSPCDVFTLSPNREKRRILTIIHEIFEY